MGRARGDEVSARMRLAVAARARGLHAAAGHVDLGRDDGRRNHRLTAFSDISQHANIACVPWRRRGARALAACASCGRNAPGCGVTGPGLHSSPPHRRARSVACVFESGRRRDERDEPWRTEAPRPASHVDVPASGALSPASVMALQRTMGNQAVQRALAPRLAAPPGLLQRTDPLETTKTFKPKGSQTFGQRPAKFGPVKSSSRTSNTSSTR